MRQVSAVLVGHSGCQQPEQIQSSEADQAAHHTEAGDLPHVCFCQQLCGPARCCRQAGICEGGHLQQANHRKCESSLETAEGRWSNKVINLINFLCFCLCFVKVQYRM